MKHFASLRQFAVFAVSLLLPAVAQAHPGHGAGEGDDHGLAHLGLGLAALVFTVVIGCAARKLSARVRANRARAAETAAAAQPAASNSAQ